MEGGDGHETGSTGEETGRDVTACGALAQQAAPVIEPTKSALDNSAPLQHDVALLVRVLLDCVVAHAVQMAPLSAALDCKDAV